MAAIDGRARRPSGSGVAGSPQAIFTVVTPDYSARWACRSAAGVTSTTATGARRRSSRSSTKRSRARRFPARIRSADASSAASTTLEFMTIVGVVARHAHRGPRAPAQPEIFMPYEQHPGPGHRLEHRRAHATVEDPLALADTMERKIRERNADVPVRRRTMESTLGDGVGDVALSDLSAGHVCRGGADAGAGGYLRRDGLHGESARAGTGVRIALGATPRNILGLVLGQGAVLAGRAAAWGCPGARLGPAAKGLLFGVEPRRPMVLAAVTGGVAVATLLACYLPRPPRRPRRPDGGFAGGVADRQSIRMPNAECQTGALIRHLAFGIQH